MGEVAKPLTQSTEVRDLRKRIGYLERATGHTGVDANARALAENAELLANLAEDLANNAQARAELAEDLANNAELLAQNAADQAANAELVAGVALTTADGKNATYRQPDEPTGGTYAVNDLWFDTDNDNLPRMWNGTAWTTNMFGSTAISSVSAATIAGQLVSDQIASVNAATIAGQLAAAQIGSVDASVLSGQVTSGQIASVSATIIAGQIAAGQIATNAVTSDKINANAVVAAKIDAGAVVADKIGANAVVAEKINAGAVVADKIATNAVVADKINAGAVVADKIATNAVVADKINAGAITADKISVNALTAKNYYTAGAGTVRIAIGPTFYTAEGPIIYWDINGDGAYNASDPRIFANTEQIYLQAGSASNGSYFYVGTASSIMKHGTGGDLVLTSDRSDLKFNTSNMIRFTSTGAAITGGLTVASGLAVTSGTISLTAGVTFGSFTSTGTITAGAFTTTGTVTGGAFTTTGTASAGSVTTTGSGNMFAGGNIGANALSTNVPPGTAAVTGTANIASGPSGFLKTITTSNRAIKCDIADLDAPELDATRLYELPVRQFRYKPGAIDESDHRVGVLVPGFIVEELAEHYPVAVDLNPQDRSPRVWNPHYLLPALLALIQDQHRRITALEEGTAP
jgi:hypothetical protein